MIKSIDVQGFHELQKLEKKPFFIDVREKDEFEEVHALGALNFPLSGLNPADVLNQIQAKKSDSLYFICRSGKRSYIAAEQFESLGCLDLTNIEGGTLAWLDRDLPSSET
jgi:rhodanese-related sulfurtransferase